MRTPSASDIPSVRNAFNGTSWTPEKREASAVQSYLDHMTAVRAEFEAFKTEENAAEIDEALEKYRAKYAQLFNTYLAAHGRLVSTAIAGGSNFPVRRMQKQGERVHKHQGKYLEWSEHKLDKLRRRFDPRLIANAPISSDDDDAVEKLQAKIAAAEECQEAMKAANKIAKSKKLTDDEKRQQLRDMGLNEQAVHDVMTPDFMGRIGFPAYALQNNNANIRRMKQRVEELQAKAGKADESQEFGDVTVERNVQDNRLQIFFPGKPGTAVRDALKRNGFIWSGRNGCWQRMLNNNSDHALVRVWPVIAAHYDTGGVDGLGIAR